MPATWSFEIQGSRLLGREHPASGLIASVSLHAQRASLSLEATARMHRESNLPGAFPGCKIVKDERVEIKGRAAQVFHVTRLASHPDTELFDAVVDGGGSFLFVSLLFEKGRSAEYREIFHRMVGSARGKDTSPEPTPGPSARPRPTEVEGKISWVGSLDQALEEARKRNVPILAALNMDNESANNRILTTHYENPQIVALSRRMVCVIGSVFDHGGYDRGGGDLRPCPRFGSVTCAAHRDVEVAVRERYLRTPAAVAPQHLLISPDGKLLARREYMLPVADLLQMMEGALRVVERASLLVDVTSAGDFLSLYHKAGDARERRELVGDILHAGSPEIAAGFVAGLAADGNEEALLEALAFAGETRHPDAGLAVVTLLGHDSEAVRAETARVIEATGDARVVDRLRSQVSREKSTSVKLRLIQALGAAGAEDDKVVGLLVKYTGTGTSSQRAAALLALRHSGPEKKILECALRAFRSARSDDVKAAAALLFGLHRITGTIPLLEKWIDEAGASFEAETGRWALACIRGEKDPEKDVESRARAILP
jgi:HEAT repeat protein